MDNFIGNFYPQSHGESLLVLEKSNERSGRDILYRCQFQKYPCEVFKIKGQILKGTCINPRIEQVEFIEKIWSQNCGDSLRIIKKSDRRREGRQDYLFECEFIKYKYTCYVTKSEVIKGTVVNPLIEKIEFIDKIWPQNCGDSLKILEKLDKGYWKCEFLSYPCQIKATKKNIIAGLVFNSEIEKATFIGKEFLQNCGDVLRVKEKTSQQNKDKKFLYRCEFKKYPYEILETKQMILNGQARNPLIFIWNNKELLEDFLKKLNYKPTFSQLIEEIKSRIDIELAYSTIVAAINSFGLQKYIHYEWDGSSFKEKEVRAYIEENTNQEIMSNSYCVLNDKEIDIYLPDLKIGFEFNGNYWHSEEFKDKNYHQEKSLMSLNKKINLYHIWEWEWDYKKDIIKSFIRSKLGIFDQKIGASRCKIKELNNTEYQVFCNKNHLQGKAGAKVKLGLFYKDELVQIMSFGVPRFTNKFEWEIIRECSKLGYCIIGGKEKLWKYFIKNYNPNSVISYCDFSKFVGNSYLRLGFKKERLNKPGFVWYNPNENQVYWRDPMNHQQKKNKYLKIYDCGQLVFVWGN